MSPILFRIGLVAAVVYIAGLETQNELLMSLGKPVPMIILILWVAGASASRYRTLILAGFVCSLCGDLFLLSSRNFVYGLSYFLVAHLLYIAAFLQLNKRLVPMAAIPFLVWGLVAVYGLYSYLGELAIPVVVYVTVICTMLWRAWALNGLQLAGARYAVYGALLFGMSDTILAINRFARPFEWADVIVILTYWAGQALIARSVVASQSQTTA